MSCESSQQFALDAGWNAAAQSQAAEALEHIKSCAECQERLRQYDQIRAALEVNTSEAAPPAGWETFERRLATTPSHLRWNWPLKAIAALAASVVIAGTAFQLGRSWIRPTGAALSRDVSPVMAGAARFAPLQLNHEVNAFDQVSKVFDGRASWMLVSDEASDVGVAPQVVSEAHQVLLLRLTLTLGGRIASEADLLVVPGQSANLTVPLAGENSLHYRIGTSADEPTHLSVVLEVNTPQGGQPLAGLSTNLRVEPGQNVTAGQLSTSAGEYELRIGFARAALPRERP